MAAAGADNAELQGLLEKKRTVQCMVVGALNDLDIEDVACTFSREGVVCLGDISSNRSPATAEDWNRALAEGFGTKLYVEWYRDTYSWGDLRLLRLGEPIFEVMRSRGLNPEWDGTRAGDFTITAVDEAGAKLAMAMALHSRLGSDSLLSLVIALCLFLRLGVVLLKDCMYSLRFRTVYSPQRSGTWHPGPRFDAAT